MSRPKLGQHWLNDKRTCASIAESLKLDGTETLIEIGGGKGALTRHIAPLCRKLIVFEIDSNWAGHLREYAPNWKGSADDVDIRETDALRINWTRQDLDIPAETPLVICGNLPYYITSPLLLNLAYSRLDFSHAEFLIQKEVARKISSSAGDSEYGRLTVSLGAFLKTEILFDVPPSAFKPPPKVTSALIRMVPFEKSLIEPELTDEFEKCVQVAFHMRRKTIQNNLYAGYPDQKPDIPKILDCMGVKPNARAQELKVSDFVTLTRLLSGKTDE